MARRRRLKVFISYARSDQAKAYELYKRLTSDGADAWIDKESLLPGQDWGLEIRKAISQADAVIVCLSKKFNKSGFRQKEVRLALETALEKPEGEIFIIPVRLEKCDNLESLTKWNWVDLFEDTGYKNLLRALSQRANKIGTSIPNLSTEENENIQPNIEKETGKGKQNSKKDSQSSQAEKFSKIEGGNNSIIVVGNVYESIISSQNENNTETQHTHNDKPDANLRTSTGNEKLVSDRVLKAWLSGHDLVKNPFGEVDLKSYPYYPMGSTRPDRWEAFAETDPLFGLCPTSDDAQVLSYRLQMECLPLKNKEMVGGVDRQIFPLWVSHRQTTPIQPPLVTLAQSAAQTWLDILSQNPRQMFDLSEVKQDTLLDLLRWSFGSAKEIIRLLQMNGLEEDVIGLSLIRKIEKASTEFSIPPIPQDVILISWLNVKPTELKPIFLILPGDNFLLNTPASWFEQFVSLKPLLLKNGIITKIISSSSPQLHLSFREINLSWSDGLDGQLYHSLQGQFDAAMIPEAKSIGIAVRFHELFGPGTTEEQTTKKLISASHLSLACMLNHGNSLFQYHCENRTKNGVTEKYLYVEDLETILNSA